MRLFPALISHQLAAVLRKPVGNTGCMPRNDFSPSSKTRNEDFKERKILFSSRQNSNMVKIWFPES